MTRNSFTQIFAAALFSLTLTGLTSEVQAAPFTQEKIERMNAKAVKTASQSTRKGKTMDIIAIRDAKFAQNPSAKSVGFMRNRLTGWVFNKDGSVEFMTQGKKVVNIKTNIISNDGRMVCVSHTASGWTGACLTLTEMSNGKSRLQVAFGNASRHGYSLANIRVQ